MNKLIRVFVLLTLLSAICVSSAQNGPFDDDPIAREITNIIEGQESDCDIIISSDTKLDHLNANDYLPVEIYDHSLCLKNSKYCRKPTKRLERRSFHCSRIIVAVANPTEFAEDWTKASKGYGAAEEGNGADEASDGDGVDEASEGNVADEVSHGSGAEEASDVNGADEASQGNGVDETSEGNGMDKASEENGADEASQGNGADAASVGSELDNASEGDEADEALKENGLDVISDGNKMHSPLFTSTVWNFRHKYSMTNNDIIYYLVSTSAEGNNPRELIHSTYESKARSINLFAIEVSRTSVSKFYYLCQFCDQMCAKITSISIDRETAIIKNIKSSIVRSKMLLERSWILRKEYKSPDDSLRTEMDKVILEFGKIDLLNPFRVRPEQVLHYMRYFVAKFLMDRINHTLTSSGIECKLSEIYYRETGQDPAWKHPENTLTWSGSETFSFLTCHYQSKVDFSTYLTPFDLYVWLGILVTSICVTTAFVLFARVSKITPSFGSGFLFVVLSAAFGTSYSPPSRIAKKFWYRFIAISWFAVTLVLCNYYTSLAIAGVTSPLPKLSIYRFEQLSSFRYCRKCTSSDLFEFERNKENFPIKDIFDLYSTPYDDDTVQAYESSESNFGHALQGIGKAYGDFESDPNHKRVNDKVIMTSFESAMFPLMAKDSSSFFPKGLEMRGSSTQSSIEFFNKLEHEITQCDKRKVYVDPTQYVKAEYEYLSEQYYWLNFTLSHETVLWHQHFMVVFRDYGSGLQKIFRGLQESGILNHMNEYYRYVLYQGRRGYTQNVKDTTEEQKKDQFQPSGLSGSIQTVFYIYLALVGLCICTFIVELTHKSAKRNIIALGFKMVACSKLVYKLFVLILIFVVEVIILLLEGLCRFLGALRSCMS
jgi:hypothetical protein